MTKPDLGHCSDVGFRAGDNWHQHQCSRKAVVERDGKAYCKIHDPEYKKLQASQKEARYCPICGIKIREGGIK